MSHSALLPFQMRLIYWLNFVSTGGNRTHLTFQFCSSWHDLHPNCEPPTLDNHDHPSRDRQSRHNCEIVVETTVPSVPRRLSSLLTSPCMYAGVCLWGEDDWYGECQGWICMGCWNICGPWVPLMCYAIFSRHCMCLYLRPSTPQSGNLTSL